jgi:hypothetical protein
MAISGQRACNLGDVTHIRPATPTNDIEPGQCRAECHILLAQFHKITGI